MERQTHSSFLEIRDLGFAYSAEIPIFDSLSFSLGEGKVGLIGDNGSGKTTLLRLIAGELAPGHGTILRKTSCYFMKQSHGLDYSETVGGFLQIREILDALARVEAGTGEEADFALLDGRWELRGQTDGILQTVGLAGLSYQKKLAELSGGEATLLSLAAAMRSDAEILLMDEPSNNLDTHSRELLYRLIERRKGLVLVSTHDRALLRKMDRIAELHDGKLLLIDGDYTVYQEHVTGLEESTRHHLHEARKALRKVARQGREMEQRQAKRREIGRKAREKKRDSKMAMGLMKRKAQVSEGKTKTDYEERLSRAKEEQARAKQQIRTQFHIRASSLDSGATHRKRLVTLEDRSGTQLFIGGGERVALLGANGIGKSRLIDSLLEEELRAQLPAWGRADVAELAVLRQNVLDLEEENTLLEELRAGQEHLVTEEEIRAQLARMLFRGESVYKKIAELSGGQRFHVALAKLLIHQPAYEMIIMDEPTNHLDLHSLHQIASLLNEYRGALLVVSHDPDFLEDIGTERRIVLTEAGLGEVT